MIEQSKLLFGDSFDYSSAEYRDAKTKIKFRCKKHDHIFEQTSNNHLKSKNPCKFCLHEHMSLINCEGLDSFISKVEAKFGKIYSFEKAKYVNQRTKILLICKKHKIELLKEPQLILNGIGCALCSKEKIFNERSSATLLEIREFIAKLNGECLSSIYSDNKSNLEFKCEVGHQFHRTWSEVKNLLRWCPKCSPNKLIGETLARLILEHLLQLKFPSVYIKEMEGLQLDGYNLKNRIAFEYQGYQHFTESSHFHSDESRYNSQIERDRQKKQLCKKIKITLIEIFEFKTIRAGRIHLFVDQVKRKLDELNIIYINEPFKLDLVDLYRGKKSELYEQAKKIVEKKKGSIQEFIGAESKHTYTCSIGHKTTNRVLSVIIKSNASCATCEALSKYETLKNIIESKGGKLIDKKLKPKGYSEQYNWICNEGHRCTSKGQLLYDGFWCRTCQKENQKVKLSPEEIQQLKKDATSGKFYQKDIPQKFGIGAAVYRRIIKEFKIQTNYLQQDRTKQTKRTKGRIVQISPIDFQVIKIFECLEAVKNDEKGLFKPEGIRHQIKKYKKAYGYYWSREEDIEETIRLIKINTTNS